MWLRARRESIELLSHLHGPSSCCDCWPHVTPTLLPPTSNCRHMHGPYPPPSALAPLSQNWKLCQRKIAFDMRFYFAMRRAAFRVPFSLPRGSGSGYRFRFGFRVWVHFGFAFLYSVSAYRIHVAFICFARCHCCCFCLCLCSCLFCCCCFCLYPFCLYCCCFHSILVACRNSIIFYYLPLSLFEFFHRKTKRYATINCCI